VLITSQLPTAATELSSLEFQEGVVVTEIAPSAVRDVMTGI
jgi:hypothetical protein